MISFDKKISEQKLSRINNKLFELYDFTVCEETDCIKCEYMGLCSAANDVFSSYSRFQKMVRLHYD